ncbi:MAG: hypothetical protein LDL14_08060 [Nitrospira sp.]|nr:hypothetical protein [Nitrospira sp.]
MKTALTLRKTDRVIEMRKVGATMWPVVCCVAIAVSGVGGWYGVTPPIATAQSRPMAVAGLTERGMVTDLSERTIVIDGRAYEVDRTVEVFDDEGNQIDLSAVMRNVEVRFRVKREDAHKIEKIMVYLAR